jgi:hypothetical protein
MGNSGCMHSMYRDSTFKKKLNTLVHILFGDIVEVGDSDRFTNNV